MKGRARVNNIVGEQVCTLPIIDLKLADGCVVVTLQAEGPFNFPANGHIFLTGEDGVDVLNGVWDIEEGMEVPARQFGTVVLPIKIHAVVG